MAIEIPTRESSPRRRFVWIGLCVAAILFGLSNVVLPFTTGSFESAITWGSPAILLGLLFVALGVKTLFRILGVRPQGRVRVLGVIAFCASAASLCVTAVIAFFFWGLTSIIANEGGQADLDPAWILLAAGVFALLAVGALALAVAWTRIEDPPRRKVRPKSVLPQ